MKIEDLKEKNKEEFIEILAEHQIIEKLVRKICKTNEKDLSQYIYHQLLLMSDNKFYAIRNRKSFIYHMIYNQFFSTTSEYYRTIKRFSQLSQELIANEED